MLHFVRETALSMRQEDGENREEVIVVGCPFATRLHLRIQLGGVSLKHATRVAARKVCSHDHDIPD